MTNVATLQTAADLSASITAQGISSLVPAGAILAFGGAIAPTGWLLCNGAAISRVTYLNLFNAIGTAHGYGDNVPTTGTFNLPDYRGRFIRGVDGAVTRDPDRAGRTAANTGGNTGDNVGSIQPYAAARPTSAFTSGAMSANSTHSHVQQFTSAGGGTPVGWGGNSTFSTWAAGTVNNTNMSSAMADISHTHTITAGGDNETRPLNAYVNYIIKI